MEVELLGGVSKNITSARKPDTEFADLAVWIDNFCEELRCQSLTHFRNIEGFLIVFDIGIYGAKVALVAVATGNQVNKTVIV